TGLDLGPLQKLYRAGSYYPRPRSAVGCAMDGDTRNAVLALTAIILACAAILVGTHATELTGSVHQLFWTITARDDAIAWGPNRRNAPCRRFVKMALAQGKIEKSLDMDQKERCESLRIDSPWPVTGFPLRAIFFSGELPGH